MVGVDVRCRPCRMGGLSPVSGPRTGEGPVYSTHSTHKSSSALRQASMVHVRDQDFKALTCDAFNEAFLTHTSTSPNQQLLASLDLARADRLTSKVLTWCATSTTWPWCSVTGCARTG